MEHRPIDSPSDDSEEAVNVGNTFLVYWCDEGLESIIDITEDLAQANLREREMIFDILKDPDGAKINEPQKRISRLINGMSLRAQFNTQRNYELYCLHTTEEITKEQLESYFDNDPQSTVNLIRERGTHMFGQGAGKRKQVIL
jgi:hypothetical protein